MATLGTAGLTELITKIKTALSAYLPLSGGTMTGAITLSDGGNPLSTAGGTMTGLIVKNGGVITASSDSDSTRYYGGTGSEKGAQLMLYGKDGTGAGGFTLQAHNGTNAVNLVGRPDGILTWNGSNVGMEANSVRSTIIAGSGSASCTMGASYGALIAVKRGSNTQLFMVDYWTAGAVTLATSGNTIATITHSANSTSVTIANSTATGITVQIISGGSLL